MRELHTAQLASLKAERGQISTDLQRAMGAVKGSAELSEMRELHEQVRYLVLTPSRAQSPTSPTLLLGSLGHTHWLATLATYRTPR